MIYKLSAIIEQEEGLYVALCPELDIASQGESLEKALANLKEALQLYLETADSSELNLPKQPPFLTTLEVSTA
jgi:predicted RNase H-like HicB family nuclease